MDYWKLTRLLAFITLALVVLVLGAWGRSVSWGWPEPYSDAFVRLRWDYFLATQQQRAQWRDQLSLDIGSIEQIEIEEAAPADEIR